MTEARMNTRGARALPDVPAWDHDLVHQIGALIDLLGAGGIDVHAWQQRLLNLFAAASLTPTLGEWCARALARRTDQVLLRRTLAGRDHTLQLLYLEPGEVHPPHCHHNVISTQVLLHGAGHAREYERIARVDRKTLRVRPLSDQALQPGDLLQSSEFARNAHWFAAGAQATVMLNLNLRGYETRTFDPPAQLGRRLLEPLHADRDGVHVLATEIDTATAYARFGGRALADFPLPVPLARSAPLPRLALGQ